MPTTLHLWINHLPLDLGVLAMLTALLGLTGSREGILRLGLWLFVAAGIAAALSYASGRVLADTLGLAGDDVSALFDEHRRLGYLGQVGAIFTAVLSGVSLALYPARRGLAFNRLLIGFVLTLALAGLFFSGRAFVSGKRFGHADVIGSAPPVAPLILRA